MLGAIIGDTVGSVYEAHSHKSTKFPLFTRESQPTDDSVMTMAIADWLLSDPIEHSQIKLEECILKWGLRYPRIGYGPMFCKWLLQPTMKNGENLNSTGIRQPYNSFGNGSAMRCSACGWQAKTLDEALDLAKRSAIITHNHPEGIKGAQSTAAAIWMARNGERKDVIRQYIIDTFHYNLNKTCDEIQLHNKFDATCQGTMPVAFAAFFESEDFEHAIRLAVSMGGDCDTITCITGSMAQAYYGEIPPYIVECMRRILPSDWWDIINKIDGIDYLSYQ